MFSLVNTTFFVYLFSYLHAIFLVLYRLDFLRFARNHNRNEQLRHTASESGCQIDVELEPYRTLLTCDLSVAEFQGEQIVVDFFVFVLISSIKLHYITSFCQIVFC